jgi:foldase protein PrsA
MTWREHHVGMPRPPRKVCAIAAVVASLAALLGCGRAGSDPTRAVARVGGAAITSATLGHWMSIMAGEHTVPDPPSYQACIAHREAIEPGSIKATLEEECRHHYEELKQRALAFLISSQWLIGEAAEQRLQASGGEVTRRLQSGTKPAILQNGGASVADERLAVDAERASAAIRRALGRREPGITQAQIADYYHHHLATYEHPEERDIYIVEHVPSAAEAARTRREVSSGMRDIRNIGLHELVRERHPAEAVPGKIALANAIFAARPHVLSGLLMFDREYAFFEVVHVAPAFVQPLVQVQAAIKTRLVGELQRRMLSQFVSAWRRKWIARTACRPGYVVQKCRQYTGPRVTEDPLALS